MKLKFFLFLLTLFLSSHTGKSQLVLHESQEDTLSYISMNADTVLHVSSAEREIDSLSGHVILTQDSLVMFCNRAIVIDEIFAYAYEDVIIIHHDSIQIYADSMRYNGMSKKAELFGEVVLQEASRRLFTNRLLYDVENKYAEYLTGGTLIDGVDTIVSKEGYYYQKQKKVRLTGNVSFVDTTKHLYTDSILYLYDIDQLNIIAPTKIIKDSLNIYCEQGVYRLESDRGVLSKNVQVQSGNQFITSGILDIVGVEKKYTFIINPKIEDENRMAEGDTIIYYDGDGSIEIRSNARYISQEEVINAPIIRYDRKKDAYQTIGRSTVVSEKNIVEADSIFALENDMTLLKGGVTILDKINNVHIWSDQALKSASLTKMFSIKRQPLLRYNLTSDSLLLIADTLISTKATANTDSASESLTAIRKVSLKNGNTYGSSQHLLFNQVDSIIVLTMNPIIWSDSTQMTGDTIKIFLKHNNVYKISLIKNAFIVSPDSSGMLNQIKGLKIDNFIFDKKLTKSVVSGNAEMFYMVKQDEDYRGINLTKSNNMTFIFDNGEISGIRMNGKPEHNMYEYHKSMNLKNFYLDGFDWRIAERPVPEIFQSIAQYYLR